MCPLERLLDLGALGIVRSDDAKLFMAIIMLYKRDNNIDFFAVLSMA